MKEQLANPAILERINVNGQRDSEDLENLLCSGLVERLVVAGQKLRLSQLMDPPRQVFLHIFMRSFAAGKARSQTNINKYLTESSKEMNFRLNAGV